MPCATKPACRMPERSALSARSGRPAQGARLSVTEPSGAVKAPSRRQLRPLVSLWPYIWRHPGMVLVALVALLASAAAMLTVPVAVRGMVDFGFAGTGA